MPPMIATLPVQIALQELIHPDLNGTRVVNTSFNSVYFSLLCKGKNVSQLLQPGIRVGGMAANEQVLPMVGDLKNLQPGNRSSIEKLLMKIKTKAK